MSFKCGILFHKQTELQHQLRGTVYSGWASRPYGSEVRGLPLSHRLFSTNLEGLDLIEHLPASKRIDYPQKFAFFGLLP